MNSIFSDRILGAKRSFIRDILKITENPDVISFAGGLPSSELFPIQEIKEASIKVLDNHGADALQYTTSEGYLPLREWISNRYKTHYGMDVPTSRILITSGSQQGLDLVGKVMLNDTDPIAIEEPGYLGAIQSLTLYRPAFQTIPLNKDGLDVDYFSTILRRVPLKFTYTVPNFQNPSGITHTDENRDKIAALVSKYNTFIIEDDPYGELRFTGTAKKSYYHRIPNQTILLGSFSKTFAPSFRIGWMVAPEEIIEKLVIAKQAVDIHTNYFSQRILHQYLLDNDMDAHIEKITDRYHSQKNAMVNAMRNYFPKEVQFLDPEGGMFLWATLPEDVNAMEVFQEAIKKNVAFVPGVPFYTKEAQNNTMRLNFTASDEATVERGIQILGEVLYKFIQTKSMVEA